MSYHQHRAPVIRVSVLDVVSEVGWVKPQLAVIKVKKLVPVAAFVLGFEGGQNPLYRRLPKRGFTNIHRKVFAIVNLDELNRFADGTEVTPNTLLESGIVKNPRDGIKILGDGDITVKITVKANKFSQSAVDKIQAAGGKTEVI